MGILTRKQSMPWGPPFTPVPAFCISGTWPPFTSTEHGFHQNWAVFTVQCYLQLRCLWIMFRYSLLSCIPDPLHHVDNNTPVYMTHALHTPVCSHGSGWASNHRCSHPPLYCYLCVKKPNVVSNFFSAFPPVMGAPPFPSCRLRLGQNCGCKEPGELRTAASSALGPIYKFYHAWMV